MTDDRDIEPDHADDAGDPAQAFEALRLSVEKLTRDVGGELTVIRKGVEAAFEEFEKYQNPPDYGPDLSQIVQQLAQVGERLQAVERLPTLRQSAQHYMAVLERGGQNLVSSAVDQLERRATGLERMTNALADRVGSARMREIQNRWLWGLSAAGLVAGVLMTLFLPRVLPGEIDKSVAATVLNADRWNAGGALMRSGHPRGWRSMVDASDFVRANRVELANCAEAATRAKKEQRCTVTVAVPAP